MSKRKRSKTAPFAMLPYYILDSAAYQQLSSHARALLVELVRQHRGTNNGDLSAAYSEMRGRRAFKSKGTLDRALNELLEAGLIERTRQGGRNRCSLYALSWLAIDECRDGHGRRKLDVASTKAPSNMWHNSFSKKVVPRMRGNATPYKGQSDHSGQ